MENSINKTNKVLNVCMTILKISVVTLHVLFTIFMFYVLIKNFLSDLEFIKNHPNEHVEGIGLVFVILVVFVAPIGYGVILLLNIIGLVLSIINEKKENWKKNKIFFIISTISVIPTYIIFFVTGIILMRFL